MGIIINGLTDTVTAADGSLNIGGDVTIPGELSYDDVTNIDSVGVVTARSGLHVTTGSVGIGTDNPQVDLHLHDSTNTRIQFTDDSVGVAAGDGVIMGLNGDDNFFINNRETSKDILLFTEDTERLRIRSDGKLMTQSAGYVYTASSAGSLSLYGGNTNLGGGIVLGGGNANADIRFLAQASTVTPAERLRITSDGDVGIGVADPDVYSLGGSNRYAAIKATAGYAVLNLVDSNNSGSYLQYGNSSVRRGSLHFNSDSDFIVTVNASNSGINLTERLRITSGGVVRVGETAESSTSTRLLVYEQSGNGQTIEVKAANTGGAGSQPGIRFTAPNNDNIGAVYGDVNSDSLQFSTGTVERLRITSGGDVLIGGQNAYTYDDTGSSNTILDIWNSGNNKRGILSLSGQTNGGAAIGTIWFNNDNNAGTGPAANMKLSAAIQADAVTSDSNAGSDAGGFLKFYTKPEAGNLIESLRITSIGDIFQRDQRVHTCLHAEYRQLSGGVNTDSVNSFVDIKNFGYSPKRAGSLIVCHFQVQTWNGSSSNMNGDIYFRARYDQGTGNYVNVTYGGNNNRMTGNFDDDNKRQHLYYTHTFGFIAQNTNQHTINLQASNTFALSTDFNWFHTADNANGCWIFEYDN